MSSLELCGGHTVLEDLLKATKPYLSTGFTDVFPCTNSHSSAIYTLQNHLRLPTREPSRMPETWVQRAFLSMPKIGHRILEQPGIHTNPTYQWETLWLFGLDPPSNSWDITRPHEKISSGTVHVTEWEEKSPWVCLSEMSGEFDGLELSEMRVDEENAAKWRVVSYARAILVDEMTGDERQGWGGVLVRLPTVSQVIGREYDSSDKP